MKATKKVAHVALIGAAAALASLPGAARASEGHGILIAKATGWGSNVYGQVGRGTTVPEYREPVKLAGSEHFYWRLATGEMHSLGISPSLSLYSWGNNNCGQLGTPGGSRTGPEKIAGAPSNFTEVAAGRDFSLALAGTGQVYAWGCNDKGQLGLGAVSGPVHSPTPVPGLSGIVQIAAGYDHALALTWDGKVYAWGLNDDGEAGDGTSSPRPAPTRVHGLTDVRMVSAGMHHTLAVREDDKLFAWGRNATGQLGVGGPYGDRLSPVQVPVPEPVQNVAAGGHHSLARTVSGGRVYAFGDNAYGQLGLGDRVDRATPTLIPSLTNVRTVAAGAEFSLAQTPSLYHSPPRLRVHSWGRNNTGQLGTDSTAPDNPQPALIYLAEDEPMIVGEEAVYASASSRHVLVNFKALGG